MQTGHGPGDSSPMSPCYIVSSVLLNMSLPYWPYCSHVLSRLQSLCLSLYIYNIIYIYIYIYNLFLSKLGIWLPKCACDELAYLCSDPLIYSLRTSDFFLITWASESIAVGDCVFFPDDPHSLLSCPDVPKESFRVMREQRPTEEERVLAVLQEAK